MDEQQLNKLYQQIIVDQIASKCKEVQQKCQNSLAEAVKAKRASLEHEESTENVEYHREIQEANFCFENVNTIVVEFEKYTELLDICRERKTARLAHLKQLQERMNITKKCLNAMRNQFSFDAIMHKLEEAIKSHNESEDAVKKIRRSIEEEKNKFLSTMTNLKRDRKIREDIESKLASI